MNDILLVLVIVLVSVGDKGVGLVALVEGGESAGTGVCGLLAHKITQIYKAKRTACHYSGRRAMWKTYTDA